MKTTKHAIKRIRQRGFSQLSIDMIRQFGRLERAPGGASRLVFGNKEYQKAVKEFKRAIQVLDKARGGSIIIKDDSLLTVYH